MPIIEYLEEKIAEPALLPKVPEDRAKVRAICEIINSGIQPFQASKALKKVDEIKGNKNEWINFFITSGLDGNL